MLCFFSTSSTEPSWPVPSRRIATVVSWVPEAINASSITSRLAEPPVPMISREVYVRPPSCSGSSISASLRRADDLDPVARTQRGPRPLGLGQHALVHRDRDPGAAVGVLVDELRHRLVRRYVDRRTVHPHRLHRFLPTPELPESGSAVGDGQSPSQPTPCELPRTSSTIAPRAAAGAPALVLRAPARGGRRV